jgi:hypothetical protein
MFEVVKQCSMYDAVPYTRSEGGGRGRREGRRGRERRGEGGNK